jgi:hypothetical protein
MSRHVHKKEADVVAIESSLTLIDDDNKPGKREIPKGMHSHSTRLLFYLLLLSCTLSKNVANRLGVSLRGGNL